MVVDLHALGRDLSQLAGLQGKRDIQAAAAVFHHQPFPALGSAAALGDDAALLLAVAGPLLLACEGLQPELVAEDPWFAGWCAVLVNLSDIAAMGGRPLALVNSLWSQGSGPAEALLAGMRFACDKFAIPMVGGHTNLQSPYTALSVAVLGMAPGPVLSARSARAGDVCCLLVNISGHFHRHYPFWDAATGAGLCHGAKDISMGGLAGTSVMLAEASACELELNLEVITPPPGVELQAWLSCFPSYGYLLVVDPARLEALAATVAPHRDLRCEPIGRFAAGPASVQIRQAGATASLWQIGEALTGS